MRDRVRKKKRKIYPMCLLKLKPISKPNRTPHCPPPKVHTQHCHTSILPLPYHITTMTTTSIDNDKPQHGHTHRYDSIFFSFHLPTYTCTVCLPLLGGSFLLFTNFWMHTRLHTPSSASTRMSTHHAHQVPCLKQVYQ